MADENDISDQRIRPSSIAPFALRLQPEVKAALEQAAQASGRSLNAEISARLEKSLQGEGEIEARLTALEREVERLRDWIVPPFVDQPSGLAARLQSASLVAAFRAEFGYAEEDLPNPLTDRAGFIDRVESDIAEAPEDEQQHARMALAELLNTLYPLGWRKP